jgi:hypothetical protein
MRSHVTRLFAAALAAFFALSPLTLAQQVNQQVGQTPAATAPKEKSTKTKKPTPAKPAEPAANTPPPEVSAPAVPEAASPGGSITESKPATQASAKGKRAQSPLGDYVPCLFDSDEEWGMRALIPPTPRPVADTTAQGSSAQVAASPKTIDYLTAIKLIDATNSAIQKLKADYNVDEFQAEFNRQLTPGALIGDTPDQAYRVIDDAARKAATTINNRFFYPKRTPPPTL